MSFFMNFIAERRVEEVGEKLNVALKLRKGRGPKPILFKFCAFISGTPWVKEWSSSDFHLLWYDFDVVWLQYSVVLLVNKQKGK